jgi:hypothetical protein
MKKSVMEMTEAGADVILSPPRSSLVSAAVECAAREEPSFLRALAMIRNTGYRQPHLHGLGGLIEAISPPLNIYGAGIHHKNN